MLESIVSVVFSLSGLPRFQKKSTVRQAVTTWVLKHVD